MKNPATHPTVSALGSASKLGAATRTILVLLRHGDAGDALAAPDRDALRPLTSKGHKQAKRAGKALVRLGLTPRDVWTSRLVRAAETARTALACAGLSPRVTATAALAPEATPERIVRALADTPPPPAPTDTTGTKGRSTGRRPVGRGSRTPIGRPPIDPAPIVRWVVGHDPHLVRLAAFAVGAPTSSFRLPKGAFAVVSFDGRGPAQGAGTMTHLIDPAALKAMAKHRRS